MQQDVILVLDLGSEENPKIAREIRALGVYSEIHPHDLTAAELNAIPNIRGVILNGGKNRIVDGVAIDASEAVYALNVPMLAVDHDAKSGEKLAAWPEDDAARASVLSAFIFDKCGCGKTWNTQNFIDDQIERIRRQVGEHGGNVEIDYVVDMEHAVVTRNKFQLNITEQNMTGEQCHA